MQKINIGFIGAGDISVLHAEAIQKIEGAELIGLWNITDDLAEEKCTLFGCKKYPTAQELVNDPSIDAIFVPHTTPVRVAEQSISDDAIPHGLATRVAGKTASQTESGQWSVR